MITVGVFGMVRLHLEVKITFSDIDLGGAESSTIGVKGSIVALVPSVGIKSVEVVFPVEFECLLVLVVGVRLDEVVNDFPRHVFCVKTGTPRIECWCPEVHHHRLGLVSKLD